MVLPDRSSIISPTPEEISDAILKDWPQYREIGDVWIYCRPSDFWINKGGYEVQNSECKDYAGMFFYLGHPDGAIVAYYDGRNPHYMVMKGDPRREGAFTAEDAGALEWVFEERLLVPREVAIEKATQLERDHRLELDDGWERLWPDYGG